MTNRSAKVYQPLTFLLSPFKILESVNRQS